MSNLHGTMSQPSKMAKFYLLQQRKRARKLSKCHRLLTTRYGGLCTHSNMFMHLFVAVQSGFCHNFPNPPRISVSVSVQSRISGTSECYLLPSSSECHLLALSSAIQTGPWWGSGSTRKSHQVVLGKTGPFTFLGGARKGQVTTELNWEKGRGNTYFLCAPFSLFHNNKECTNRKKRANLKFFRWQ